MRSLRKSIFRLGLWLPAGARRAVRSRRIVAPVFNARFTQRANVNTTGSKQTWPSAKKDQGETRNAGLNLGWLNVQSLRNKTTAIYDIIEERNLDVAILTETWHGSGDDISLRLAAPSSYSAVDAVRKSDPNHSGIVVIHRSRYRCVRVLFPDFTSFEGLCVRLHVGGESVTLLSIYRPGSCRPSTLFFEELRTVLEMLVLQPGLIILGGDINIHVEKEDDDDSVRFSELIVFQHDSTRRRTDSPAWRHTGPGRHFLRHSTQSDHHRPCWDDFRPQPGDCLHDSAPSDRSSSHSPSQELEEGRSISFQRSDQGECFG